jgi:hypothetical protein
LKLLEPEEAVETVYGVVGRSIAERVLEEVSYRRARRSPWKTSS